MAQLDKMIGVMLGRSGSDIVLAAGAEPCLRVDGAAPHALVKQKLGPSHLRLLIEELVGASAVRELEVSDGGEFTYAANGQAVTVIVRGWSGNVEARLRPAASASGGAGSPGTSSKKGAPTGAAVARIELARVPADGRRGPGGTGAEVRSARPPERPIEPSRHAASDDLEVDLSGPLVPREPSPSWVDESELELELQAPPSSSRRSLPTPGTSDASGAPASASSTAEPPINALFRAMIKEGGSDLHLSTGERPMIRRDGDMARLSEQLPRLKGTQVMELLRPIMGPDNRAEFERDHDTDFAYEIEGVSRFRGNVFLDRRGVGCVFRTIPTEIVSAEKLGLSASIQNLCYLSKGLVLVTGPTGSGKSTTLSALIDLINRSRHEHIITIEDPIEFVHQSKSCLINQRQVGSHTDSFKRALRAALREDPDVVMVGEMRDLETIAIALETAETGHLVFATLHTSTSYSTVDRLIDSFPADRQAQIRVMLSESLKGVVSQTLCKKIGGGRIAAYEVLLVNSAIANLIREGKTFQIPSAMQTSRKQGMVLLNDALFDLVERKKIEPREAYIKSVDKASFVSQLRAAGQKLDFLG